MMRSRRPWILSSSGRSLADFLPQTLLLALLTRLHMLLNRYVPEFLFRVPPCEMMINLIHRPVLKSICGRTKYQLLSDHITIFIVKYIYFIEYSLIFDHQAEHIRKSDLKTFQHHQSTTIDCR